VQVTAQRLRGRRDGIAVECVCTSASKQLFSCDRQAAYTLTGHVKDGIGNRGRNRHGGQFTEALCAEGPAFLVEIADEYDVEFGFVASSNRDVDVSLILPSRCWPR
jgi:hypothetical protein